MAEEGIGPLGTGVIDCCESSMWVLGIKLRSLEEQQIFLNTEPSLQPYFVCIFETRFHFVSLTGLEAHYVNQAGLELLAVLTLLSSETWYIPVIPVLGKCGGRKARR